MPIKLNTTDVSIPGYAKAYFNGNLMWLADLPPAYLRVEGFSFNNNCYFTITGLKLTGADTIRFTFKPKSGSNVFGSYTTTSAQNNYSLFISTASTTSKYMRYNGGTYASGFTSGELNVQRDVVITPTGSSGLPRNGTWTQADFVCDIDMNIGTTSPDATSAKFIGDMIGNFVVDGKFCGVPCKRISDNTLGYFDLYTRTFFTPAVGTPTVVE